MRTGIIAFCASKKSGKSTAFNFLKEMYSGQVEELALAGYLKEVCSKVFNIDMKYFLDQNLKEKELEEFVVIKGSHLDQVFKEFDVYDYVKSDLNKFYNPHRGKICVTPRELLQYIGTEVLHPVDPLVHVKKAINLKSKDKLTVVTDLRFKVEYEFFMEQKDFPFKAFYIDNNIAKEAAMSDSHPSERQLFTFNQFCTRIDNNGSLTDLKRQIGNLIELYLEDNREPTGL